MDIITLALAKRYVQETLEGQGALKGNDGKSAYDIAVEQGFEGTIDEWLASFGDKTGLQNQINNVKASVIWIDGM